MIIITYRVENNEDVRICPVMSGKCLQMSGTGQPDNNL